MSILRLNFEKELLQRLSEQKITTLHSKMNKMLKLFSEVEINKNHCNRDDFVKVMMSVGVKDINDASYSELFDIYCNNDEDSLNYKDFILNIFNPKNIEKLKNDPEKDIATMTIKPKPIKVSNIQQEPKNEINVKLVKDDHIKEGTDKCLKKSFLSDHTSNTKNYNVDSSKPFKSKKSSYLNFINSIKDHSKASNDKDLKFMSLKKEFLSTNTDKENREKSTETGIERKNSCSPVKEKSENNCNSTDKNCFKGENSLLENFRKKIFQRGGSKSIIALSKQFRIYDRDKSGTMSYEEFEYLIHALKINVTDQELKGLFLQFDNNEDHSINYEEFISTIMGELNNFRKNLIMKVFFKLDNKNQGFIGIENVKGLYDSTKHPDVILNKKSSDHILKDFIESFELHKSVYQNGRKNNLKNARKENKSAEKIITKDQFLDYYKHISCSIQSDKYFEEMINNSWKMFNDTGTNSDLEDKRKKEKWAQEYFTNKEQKIDTENILNMIEKNSSSSKFKKILSKESMNKNNTNLKINSWNNKLEDKYHQINKSNDTMTENILKIKPNIKPIMTHIVEYGEKINLNEIFAKFRNKLSQRGSRGITGISRAFRVCDTNKNSLIDGNEFTRVCRDYQIGLNDAEISALFRNFDKNGNGEISYDEFLKGLLGKMNAYRSNLVKKAFEKIDQNNNQIIEIAEIKKLYDVKYHPDVLSGKLDEDTALSDFMDIFEDQFGTRKDKSTVTYEEFVDYYNNISVSIENDKYFGEIINKVWNLKD